MLRPQYMLLDEPTSALDAGTTADFAKWLRELHEDTNFIIVTHDVPFARQTACQGIYMKQGQVIHAGTIDAILAALKSDRAVTAAAETNERCNPSETGDYFV